MRRSGFNNKKRTGFSNRRGFTQRTGLDKLKKKRNGLRAKARRDNNKDPRWNEIHKADKVFSQLVRLSESNTRGECRCFTCGYRAFWKRGGIECGHYKSRSHYRTRWMMYNAHPQCTHCNQVLNGNLERYRERLIETYGEGVLDYLDRESKKVVNLTAEDIRQIRLKLERKLRKIRKEKGL